MDERELKLAELAYNFMQRVQLQGNEVPAFTAVVEWLRAKAVPPPVQPPAEEKQDG